MTLGNSLNISVKVFHKILSSHALNIFHLFLKEDRLKIQDLTSSNENILWKISEKFLYWKT